VKKAYQEEIIKYIKTCQQEGFSVKEITDALVEAGWQKDDIQKCFELTSKKEEGFSLSRFFQERKIRAHLKQMEKEERETKLAKDKDLKNQEVELLRKHLEEKKEKEKKTAQEDKDKKAKEEMLLKEKQEAEKKKKEEEEKQKALLKEKEEAEKKKQAEEEKQKMLLKEKEDKERKEREEKEAKEKALLKEREEKQKKENEKEVENERKAGHLQIEKYGYEKDVENEMQHHIDMEVASTKKQKKERKPWFSFSRFFQERKAKAHLKEIEKEEREIKLAKEKKTAQEDKDKKAKEEMLLKEKQEAEKKKQAEEEKQKMLLKEKEDKERKEREEKEAKEKGKEGHLQLEKYGYGKELRKEMKRHEEYKDIIKNPQTEKKEDKKKEVKTGFSFSRFFQERRLRKYLKRKYEEQEISKIEIQKDLEKQERELLAKHIKEKEKRAKERLLKKEQEEKEAKEKALLKEREEKEEKEREEQERKDKEQTLLEAKKQAEKDKKLKEMALLKEKDEMEKKKKREEAKREVLDKIKSVMIFKKQTPKAEVSQKPIEHIVHVSKNEVKKEDQKPRKIAEELNRLKDIGQKNEIGLRLKLFFKRILLFFPRMILAILHELKEIFLGDVEFIKKGAISFKQNIIEELELIKKEPDYFLERVYVWWYYYISISEKFLTFLENVAYTLLRLLLLPAILFLGLLGKILPKTKKTEEVVEEEIPQSGKSYTLQQVAHMKFIERLAVMDIIRLSKRMFETRRLRTFLTILGMSVGTGTILFLVSLGYGLQNILFERITSADALITLDVFPAGPDVAIKLNDRSIQEFSTFSEVDTIGKLVSVDGGMTSENQSQVVATINLVDQNYRSMAGEKFVEGAFDSGAVVSSAATIIMGFQDPKEAIGKKVKPFLLVPEEPGSDFTKTLNIDTSFEITGVVDDAANPFVYFPLEELKSNLPELNYTHVKIRTKGAEFIDPLKEKVVAEGFQVAAISDTLDQAKKIFDIARIILALFGIVTLIVSAIGMLNTMTIALLERTQEVGIMKSIGASNLDIWELFLAESAIMGFLGGVGGIAVGYIGSWVFNYGINLLAKTFGGQALDLFQQPLWFVITIVVFSFVVGILTGLMPARRASRLDPLTALKQG